MRELRTGIINAKLDCFEYNIKIGLVVKVLKNMPYAYTTYKLYEIYCNMYNKETGR